MKSVQPNKSPRERREALLEEKRASSCTVESIVLPLCLHCGGKPELKRKTVDSCDGWASDYYEWIECECGMRTIERSITYYRPKVIKDLIEIFSGQNAGSEGLT